jgi:hypothetical protein
LYRRKPGRIRDQLFAPDHLESYRHDDDARAEPGRYNPVAHAVGGTMTRWSGWSWRFREDDFRVLSAEGPLAGAALADWPVRMPSWPLRPGRARVRGLASPVEPALAAAPALSNPPHRRARA